MGVEHWMG